jgi:hypothetical protein
MKRARRAVSAVMALGVAATSACDSAEDPAPTVTAAAPAPCRGGTAAITPPFRHVVVTDVSDVINARRGTPFTAALRPVRTVVPAVEASGPVDAAAVFAEFAKQAGPAIAPLDEASPREATSGLLTVDGNGAMVTYQSVQRVESSFTYRCGTVAVSGVVSSWARPRSGIMRCDNPKQPAVDIVTQVAALACRNLA